MKYILFIPLLFLLCGCTYVPEIAKDLDDIATNDAIVLKLDRDTVKQNPDIHVKLDILNKPKP